MVSYWYIIFVYESLPQGRNGGPKLQGSKIGDEEGRVAPQSLGDTVLQDRSWCPQLSEGSVAVENFDRQFRCKRRDCKSRLLV